MKDRILKTIIEVTFTLMVGIAAVIVVMGISYVLLGGLE